MTITKTVRLSGSSDRSIEHAITTVLGRAAVTTTDITGFELVRAGGTVDSSGVVSAYDVTLDITFEVREPTHN